MSGGVAASHLRASVLWTSIALGLSPHEQLRLETSANACWQQWLALLQGSGLAADSAATMFRVDVAGLPVNVRLSYELIGREYLPFMLLFDVLVSRKRRAGTRAIVGIVGAAGSGKTTLTQLLCHLYNCWRTANAAAVPGSDAAADAASLATAGDGSAAPSAAAAAVSMPCPSSCVALSMDAYHRRNADLIAAGLKQHKGRIDTMDAVAFAADVAAVARDGSAIHGTPRSELRLPVYDRAVTHDPISGALALPPTADVLLVEGLYLACAGEAQGAHVADASAGACSSGVGSSGPSLEPAQASAWRDLRWQLDLLVMLRVPLPVCAARVVARKVSCGAAPSAALSYYIRVDLPIYQRIASCDALRPGRPLARVLSVDCGSAAGSAVVGSEAREVGASASAAAAPTAACAADVAAAVGGDGGDDSDASDDFFGPDLLLDYDISADGAGVGEGAVNLPASGAFEGESDSSDAARLITALADAQLQLACASTPSSKRAGGGLGCSAIFGRSSGAAVCGGAEVASKHSEPQRQPQRPRIVVLGLNPCVQRTLVFGTRPSASTSTPAAAAHGGAAAAAAGATAGAAGATAVSSAAAASQCQWRRGQVNRASQCALSSGGKGQHAALAAARALALLLSIARCGTSSADSSSPGGGSSVAPAAHTTGAIRQLPDVHLLQILAGQRGAEAERLLVDALTSAGAQVHVQDDPASGGESDAATGGAAKIGAAALTGRAASSNSIDAAAVRVRLHTQWAAPAAAASPCTRMCTTLVDCGAGDSTELIEPSAAVPEACTAALLADVGAAIAAGDAPSAAAPSNVHAASSASSTAGAAASGTAVRRQQLRVAIMGTAPPGAAAAYGAVCKLLAELPFAATAFTLLDLSSGAAPLLATGAVTMLKVNASELLSLAAAAASASHCGAGVASASKGAAYDHNVFQAMFESGDAAQVAAEGTLLTRAAATLFETAPSSFRFVAVTDGPHAAHLFERLPNCVDYGDVRRASALRLRHWRFRLPELPVPVVNPIGAGDTVAGVCLASLSCGCGSGAMQPCGHAVAAAFSEGLAAGSASCATLLGAHWEFSLQQQLFKLPLAAVLCNDIVACRATL